MHSLVRLVVFKKKVFLKKPVRLPLCYSNKLFFDFKQLFYGLLTVLCFFKYLCLKLFKIVFMKKLYNIVLGIGGVGSIEVVKNVDLPTTAETKDIISIIIQLAIGVATLIGLLKKKTPKS